MQERGAGQAGGAVVVARDHRPEYRERIARCRLCRCSRTVEHGDVQPARRQGMCNGCARDAGTDDGDAARHRRQTGRLAGKTCRQTMPFAPVALALGADETGIDQTLPHRCRHRVSRRRRIRTGQPCEFGKQRGLPQIGIAVGRKPVEIKGVHTRIQIGQAIPGVAQHQGELHATAIKREPVKTGQGRRPGRDQFCRQAGKVRP